MLVKNLSETAASSLARHRLIAACGVVIFVTSAGAALLPVIDHDAEVAVIAALLVGAGMVEIYAGTLHWRAKGLSVLAGVVTVLSGLLFALNPQMRLMGTATIVTAWLLVRGMILLAAGLKSAGSVRMWTIASATMDIFLALLLITGISISMLIVSLFGPTSQMVASFSWIFALSFAVTGAMLINVARCEGRAKGD